MLTLRFECVVAACHTECPHRLYILIKESLPPDKFRHWLSQNDVVLFNYLFRFFNILQAELANYIAYE
jgi:hypothetical protein